MRRADLSRLGPELRAAGVAERYVQRIVHELADHLADAQADAETAGFTVREARGLSLGALGTRDTIVAAVASRAELMRWQRRWPGTARRLETLCYYALLPAAPFVYCAERGEAIGRWSLSTSLAALITAVMLFCLQAFFR